MEHVIIGADPHKHSVTIEVVDQRERVLHKGRYSTDAAGYQQMLAAASRFPQRRWAVEGCNGIGKHVAQRLVADGESVVDVPAKLAARARCSIPATAARPTRLMPTRWPWSRYAHRT